MFVCLCLIHPRGGRTGRRTGGHIMIVAAAAGGLLGGECAGFPIQQRWPSWLELPNIKRHHQKKGVIESIGIMRGTRAYQSALRCTRKSSRFFSIPVPGAWHACQQKPHTVSTRARIPRNAVPTSHPNRTAQHRSALRCTASGTTHTISQKENCPPAYPGPCYRSPRQAGDARRTQQPRTRSRRGASLGVPTRAVPPPEGPGFVMCV